MSDIYKWFKSYNLSNKLRPKKQKVLISTQGFLNINKALIEDSCLTDGKNKKKIKYLIASKGSIRKCIKQLDLRKVSAKYSQTVSPNK